MDHSYWRTVSLITVWQVAASICYYTIFAATPFFRDEYGLSRFYVGLVVTALTLGYAVWLLPIGALTDRFGEHRALTYGLIGLSIGVIIVAAAPTFALLLIAVFLLGSTYSSAMPGTNKAIYDNIEAGKQNFAMGIKMVGVTAGSGISALLVTGLAGILFWQAGFLVAGLVAVIIAGLFYHFYTGMSVGGTASYPNFRGLLQNRPYRWFVLSGFFLGAVLFSTTGYTVLFVEEEIGASILFAGVVLALVQLFGSAGRIITGWLSDVLPGNPQTRIGGILAVQILIGASVFLAVPSISTRLEAALVFSVLGFFILGNTGVYYSCMATIVASEDIGGATAGGQLSLVAGSIVAPPAFGYLADTVGYRASWLFLSVVSIIAVAIVLIVIRVESPVEKPAMVE